MIDVKTTITISGDRIRGLLCSAFEGGSNYWYRIKRYDLAEGITLADVGEGGRLQEPGRYWHPSQLVPLLDDCAVVVTDTYGDDGEETDYRLDRRACARGIQVMADKYPKHFGDAMNENGDAATGDVYLQCCLFGEIVYG